MVSDILKAVATGGSSFTGTALKTPARVAKSIDIASPLPASKGKQSDPVCTPPHGGKRGRQLQASPAASASPSTLRKAPAPRPSPVTISGDGTHQHPYRASLRSEPNADDCLHCEDEHCICTWFSETLEKVYSAVAIKRVTEICGKRNMCAKSILPPFVSRMVKILNMTPGEVFYDLGCGNGSVCFQVAFMTGNPCVGVELSEHNAELARQAWAILRPKLEKKCGRAMPHVEIITGDLAAVISKPEFIEKPCSVWTANLLMPKSLTHFMSERFRLLPPGSRILCFDDLYPHSRSVATIRDPEAFRLFQMVDYVWQEMSVEWTAAEGRFYLHKRTQAIAVRPVDDD